MSQSLPSLLAGVVTRFSGDGRKLGYPTANLTTATDLADGIYFGFADLEEFAGQPALIFVGTPTTMGRDQRRVEAHLLDIPDRDYYDSRLTVQVHHYYRANQTFASVAELQAVLTADESAGREWFRRREVAIRDEKGNT